MTTLHSSQPQTRVPHHPARYDLPPSLPPPTRWQRALWLAAEALGWACIAAFGAMLLAGLAGVMDKLLR